jgi:hypothetical protein
MLKVEEAFGLVFIARDDMVLAIGELSGPEGMTILVQKVNGRGGERAILELKTARYFTVKVEEAKQ